jgi:hypothetical protein
MSKKPPARRLPVDIPLVLERLRPGVSWGPNAGSYSTYADLAATWPGPSAVPTQAEMDAAWTQILAERVGVLPGSPEWLAQDRGHSVGAVSAVRLALAQSTSLIALSDVAGLSFQLKANSHYAYEFVGAYSAAAATTGLKLAVNGPATPVMVRMAAWLAESVAAARYGAFAAYDTPLAGLNSGGATNLPFSCKGNVSTGAVGGPFTLRFASEVAGSQVTVGAGSYGLLYGVG